MMLKMLGPKYATRVMMIISVGKVITISVNR